MSAKPKLTLSAAMLRALAYLADQKDGAGAGDVGNAAWPNRVIRAGRGVATGGGGDYAAQMMLGRLREAGLVRRLHTPGSTMWAIDTRGRVLIAGAIAVAAINKSQRKSK